MSNRIPGPFCLMGANIFLLF